MTQSAILECWQHTEREGGASIILPDGCRDVIVRQNPHRAPECHVSVLADGVHQVPSTVGASFTGFRLHPAVILGPRLEVLMAEVQEDSAELRVRIEENTHRCERASECLRCIEQAALPIELVAAELGVSMRSLQRVIGRATGRSPNFWRQLARARRTARELSSAVDLADHAMRHGFSDQPHMNREFRRWFAVSPREFSQREDLRSQLLANAFS